MMLSVAISLKNGIIFALVILIIYTMLMSKQQQPFSSSSTVAPMMSMKMDASASFNTMAPVRAEETAGSAEEKDLMDYVFGGEKPIEPPTSTALATFNPTAGQIFEDGSGILKGFDTAEQMFSAYD